MLWTREGRVGAGGPLARTDCRPHLSTNRFPKRGRECPPTPRRGVGKAHGVRRWGWLTLVTQQPIGKCPPLRTHIHPLSFSPATPGSSAVLDSTSLLQRAGSPASSWPRSDWEPILVPKGSGGTRGAPGNDKERRPLGVTAVSTVRPLGCGLVLSFPSFSPRRQNK